ncbi:MAG TPA: kelch repeat-containing protein, partial [Rhodanobacteraceae bacterium]|nr:kelch repeat-containing protein [Rhodanobacteraceae bacterium]
APTGSMTTPRYVASGTLLDDGTVLIAGGFQGRDVLDTAEIYDPATGTFAPTGSLPEPRLDPALVLLGDGRVLAAGGSDGNNNYAATAMLFDPATGTFTPTADLNFPRDGHTGTKLADGRVLIAGGSHLGGADPYVATAEIYDPATGTFAIAGDIPEPRYAATASALADGRVLIAGGWAGPDSRPTASAVLFTPELGDEIFRDGFDPPPEVSISNYDDLVEGFLGESYAYNGVSYHDVNGIGGVFPDGSTFTPEDVGNQLIVEDSTVFYADFPDFGSPPNTLTFGTSFVPGENLTIGALVRVTMDLDTPMSEATVDLGYYENGPWGGIVIHLDALDGDTVVASDELTIANGGDRDNPTTARFTVSASSFTSLKLYSTYEDQPSAPRIMIDDLTLTPATSAQP